jgi:hypothetical protein
MRGFEFKVAEMKGGGEGEGDEKKATGVCQDGC